YPTEMDGKKESGPETFDWKQFFALSFIPEDNPPTQTQRPDTGSGGFEIWTRWDSTPSSATLFDIKEQQTTNRVTLRVENNELILTAADSTIPNSTDPDGRIANGVAEIRWPNFKISQDTWTHFGAYWKSNRYADLAMLVDGFSDPQAKFMHYTGPGGSELMTTLSSALTPTSTSLTLKNSGILPSASELSPIQIGDEVILYDQSAGTVVRGARGTVADAHPSQANVSLFGYSSKIRSGQVVVNWPPGTNYSTTLSFDRIPQTNATLTYNFGLAPTATVCGDKMDPLKPALWEFSPTATQLGVITPNIMDYPDQGYIRIDNEVLFYTARSTGGVAGTFPPSTAKFTGLTRAMFGSVAAPHPMGNAVHLWSVAANNLNNYPQITIIAVGTEWFGPVQKDPSGKNYWVGFMNGPVPVNFERGYNCLFSVPSAHSAGDKVLPTFLGQDVNTIPSTTLASMGAGDRVTLVDGTNMKAVARIRRTSTDPRPNGIAGWAGSFQIQGNAASQIASLYDFTTRDWVADNLHCRILKFPSGELLSLAWLQTASPQVTIGPVAGQIDELKAFAGSKGRIRLALQAGVGDTTLTVHPTALGPFQNGGLMKVGDEYLGYGSWPSPTTNGVLSEVKRGWLNSTAELHDKGDVAFYLPWVPVAALSGDVSVTDKVIHVKQRLSGDPHKYTSGYVLLDNEMVLFQWNGDDGLTLSMPPTMDGQRGLYRGMFGTQPASHSSTTSLAYGMPFRVWDTYKAREFDNSMVYFQWSTQLDLAHWNSYLWRQTMPQGERNIVIHGMARIDGKGDFWDPPGMSDLTLLVDSVTGTGKLNRIGHLNDAGQLDVRFYVEYKPGSFEAQNPRSAESWKRAPKIQEIQVEYDRPIQTLHHEDR
ncbi:MAG TPA: hypothetical protein VMU54_09430, partial [Planctomycetota bacterium]|nr:hypothetical protein [Planctomycetota bacterium]